MYREVTCLHPICASSIRYLLAPGAGSLWQSVQVFGAAWLALQPPLDESLSWKPDTKGSRLAWDAGSSHSTPHLKETEGPRISWNKEIQDRGCGCCLYLHFSLCLCAYTVWVLVFLHRKEDSNLYNFFLFVFVIWQSNRQFSRTWQDLLAHFTSDFP